MNTYHYPAIQNRHTSRMRIFSEKLRLATKITDPRILSIAPSCKDSVKSDKLCLARVSGFQVSSVKELRKKRT